MKSKVFRYKLLVTIIGAIGGFLYWKYIGCASGTCPIKSVWYLMTLWGTAMGYLLGDLSVNFVVKREAGNDKTV
ncbi:hypothetical protein AQPE_0490 [Aquipluma nitroreducens]|uniref:Uncharacterized protein n=1 Tax=Aquipluma nitroreducens TaxID=2010828 RepID=A0A5K7S476_9BACT|nr:DUF6132 family protein [Aquipluma nitroreducens]BBE16352.1 hypothetical protein AQPE_0490 [Aquipluma nitroreducens]